MKYVKTYEGFIGKLFGKKTKKEPMGINLSKNDIIDIVQELNDDFNLNITEDRIDKWFITPDDNNYINNLNIDKNSIKDCDTVESDRPYKGGKYVSFKLYKIDNIYNCYSILLNDPDITYYESYTKDVDNDDIIKILDYKKDSYGFDYIITSDYYFRNNQTGIRSHIHKWRILIFNA